jgi:hypothetical protein
MLNAWWQAADVGHTIMLQAFQQVLSLVEAHWAVAFVVVHKVLTIARRARTRGAVILVLAGAGSFWFDDLIKSALADAFVVFLMHSCWARRILTLSVHPTVAGSAIIHVRTAWMLREFSHGQTGCAQGDLADELAIDRISRLAAEGSIVTKDVLGRSARQLTVTRNHNGTSDWSASPMCGVSAISLTCNVERNSTT